MITLFSVIVCLVSHCAADLVPSSAKATWTIVNDGVMGGRSVSRVTKIPEGYRFSGYLSLENNGGFASARTRPSRRDLSGADGMSIRVRGDGRVYQLRLRTSGRLDGIAYRAEFPTTKGEWREVSIPFRDFEPTWRGRRVRGAPPLDTGNIGQVIVMVADGREGLFQLDIATIESYRENGQ